MLGRTCGTGEKKAGRFVILFFAAMFLLGALGNGTYGIPWDEKTEQAILNANTREYLHCVGREDLIPEYSGEESEYRISTSIEKDHGIAVYYPIGLYILHRDSLPTKEVSLVWQSYTYAVNFLGVLALYGLVKALYGSRKLGMTAAAMYFFTPRMFAEMHYNNKDMVCLTLVMLTLYFGVRWIQTHRLRFAVPFAVAGAFAANARLIAAFAFGLVGVCYLGLYLQAAFQKKTLSPQEKKTYFLQGILAILACGIAYILITPAMWSQPVGYVRYLVSNTFSFSRWNGTVLFNGAAYGSGTETLPRSYLPTMIAITTPIYLLVLTLIGTAAVWIRAWRSRGGDIDVLSPMVSVMWLFPLLLAVVLNTFVYNGWRQFYFIYGPMMVCAAGGIHVLSEWLQRFGKLPVRIGGCLLAALIAASAVGIALNHPYQSGYCNVLAGENAERRFELDYWHLASGPLVGALVEELTDGLAEGEEISVGRVSTYDDHALNAAYRLLTEEQQARFHRYRGVTTDYVILNLSYLHMMDPSVDPLTPLSDFPQYALGDDNHFYKNLCYVLENFHEHSRAVSYGNTLMILYERNNDSN